MIGKGRIVQTLVWIVGSMRARRYILKKSFDFIICCCNRRAHILNNYRCKNIGTSTLIYHDQIETLFMCTRLNNDETLHETSVRQWKGHSIDPSPFPVSTLKHCTKLELDFSLIMYIHLYVDSMKGSLTYKYMYS